jgi:hypothetical protein
MRIEMELRRDSLARRRWRSIYLDIWLEVREGTQGHLRLRQFWGQLSVIICYVVPAAGNKAQIESSSKFSFLRNLH